jgi:hypothetical protein
LPCKFIKCSFIFKGMNANKLRDKVVKSIPDLH